MTRKSASPWKYYAAIKTTKNICCSSC